MTRWDIKNHLFPVSHKQFLSLAQEFKQAVENAFHTPCYIHVDVLSKPKEYTTFWDDEVQANLDARNNQARIMSTYSLDDIDQATWKSAGYVDIHIRPYDEEHAPRAAFATAEFKGVCPKQATFYIQPDGEDAKDAMLQAHPSNIHGDGFTSNGQQNMGALAKVQSKLGIPFDYKGFR